MAVPDPPGLSGGYNATPPWICPVPLHVPESILQPYVSPAVALRIWMVTAVLPDWVTAPAVPVIALPDTGASVACQTVVWGSVPEEQAADTASRREAAPVHRFPKERTSFICWTLACKRAKFKAYLSPGNTPSVPSKSESRTMLRSSPLAGLLRGTLCLALLVVFAVPAAAQRYVPQPLQRPQFGIGYIANLPDVQVGGGAYVLLPRWGGVGLYVDAKFGVSGPSSELGYDANVTVEDILSRPELAPNFVKTESSWWSVNAALMRPLSPYFTLYLGGGVAHQTAYALYNVRRDQGVGVGGVVWARDPGGDQYRPNLLFGMITRLTARVSAHFGYETQPDGVTAGLSLRLPRW